MKLLIFLFFSCPVYGLTKYSLTTLLTLEGYGEISDPFFNTEGKKLREKMGR
jgi:hypothetical protein